ncbi:COX assembly mitochondrial protein homolog [Nasonia vitripennis]|uniref:COX assembly mitochondrial protein n=1 Tax=Nasonia vitripennis TaxID=7425 RepID=A0A7M7G8B0_NASVI|nr:COX assembly mitochondrial protein homolog [Nasonia vitripennis]
MADEEQKTQEKVKYTVLSKKLGGGPHGLGDPDDLSMRKVEKDILVAKVVRDRTRDEKCVPEVAAFNECCKESKYLMVFTCRKQNAELKECLTRWYKDEDFWEECKQQYLKERSDFRRTGEPKKIRDFKARIGNMF